MPPCIIAMGGSGWDRDENPLLVDYVLSHARKQPPRVCFLPTAGGDCDRHIVQYHEAFRDRDGTFTHLPLFRRTIEDLRTYLLSQDVIWVGGGNTANMLAVWKLHGVTEILREAWEQGIVLCGSSAGSICWFESGVTDSYGKRLQPIHGCLGFLPGSHCPHYDGEPLRRPSYKQMVADGELPAGMAADDFAAVRYAGTEVAEVVSARPRARVWQVSRSDAGFEEVEVQPRYLGEASA